MNRHSISLLKKDPFREIRELERRFFNDPFFFPSLYLGNETREFVPVASELTEDENNYYLSVELPGMAKEDIKIEADKRSLKVSGEKKEEKQASRRGHYSEFSYGAFSRDYQFRETISEDKIKAIYQNGILELTIPKSGEIKLKHIEIR